MLSWFRAPAPLVTSEKAWTERSMCRLADRFGLEPLRKVEFLIPAEHFPNYVGTEEQARAVFEDVCRAMQVPESGIGLEIIDDTGPSEAASADEPDSRPVIRFLKTSLDDLCRVTAAIACEAARLRIREGELPRDNEPDLESAAELLPIFFGYGVFVADATIRQEFQVHGISTASRLTRQGDVPSRICGYALALAAAFRGEYRPRWSRDLRPDAKQSFVRGQRYLDVGNSLFHPSTYVPNARQASVGELVAELRNENPSVRFDALDRLERRLSSGVKLAEHDIEQVLRLLDDRDVDVAAAAARTLSACRVSVPIKEELLRVVWHSRTPVRAAAIRALGRLGACEREFVDGLERFMAEDDAVIVGAALDAAALVGRHVPELATPLLRLLERANIGTKGVLSQAVVRALADVTGDPLEAVEAYYAGGDPELLIMAVDAVHATRLADRSAAEG
jgi:hypothetical protein